jgi:hypothetical protein
MPARRYNRHRKEDSCCFELFLFMFFFYCTFKMWEPNCNWFFNVYVVSSYGLMIVIRRFQAAVLDELENNMCYQIIMMGIMMPIFLAHTTVGGIMFFTADLMKCRTPY